MKKKNLKVGKNITPLGKMAEAIVMMTEDKIKCPKCNVLMDKLTNGKFIIDKCPSCEGVFLDKEEIGNINKQGFVSYIRNYFRRDKQ